MYLNEQIAKETVFNYLTNNLKLGISFLDHYLRVGKLNQQNAVYLRITRRATQVFKSNRSFTWLMVCRLIIQKSSTIMKSRSSLFKVIATTT